MPLPGGESRRQKDSLNILTSIFRVGIFLGKKPNILGDPVNSITLTSGWFGTKITFTHVAYSDLSMALIVHY